MAPFAIKQLPCIPARIISAPVRSVSGLIVLAAALALAGCDRGGVARDGGWHGYVYANILANDAPRVTDNFPSGEACLTAMHRAMHGATPLTGWACARDCTQTGRFAADCQDMRP
jgi:hypothetical protein